MSVMDDEHHTPPDDELGGIPHPYNRDDIEYGLIVRQEPKQARMCGVGTKADRRPIDPPPVVQLRVIEKGSRSRRSSSPDDRPVTGSHLGNEAPASTLGYLYPERMFFHPAHYNQSFLQNPYYFMYASLANPDRDEELHLLKDGKTRCTTGSVVSSLYHLKDPEADSEGRTGRDAGFFVFPDLSVRTEGTYRLKLTLFEVIGANVHHCKSIFSAPFYVYTAKKFPGMEESTNLSCALADQGIKIRIRKDVRVRKRTMDPNWFQPVQRDDASDASEDEAASARDPKRQRNEGGGVPPPPPPAAVPPPPASAPPGGTWGAINPIPPGPAPPPPPPPAGPDASPYDTRSSFSAGSAPAPTATGAPTPAATAGAVHPEYPPQPHQHAPYMPPPPPPGGMYAGAYGWGPVPPPPPHAQGYGAYPGYDHHRAQPYGAPAMHYGAPPPPYAYYDQHGQYGHPPPAAPQPQPQAPQQSPQNESPRSAGATSNTSTGQAAQQGRGGKDPYPPPPPSAPAMIPSYSGQDYGYGRPPPPPPASVHSTPTQGRPYHTSPGPAAPPQSAPAAAPGGMPGSAYTTPPQAQGHMGHYMPAHQHTPYGYGGAAADPYQHQHPQHPQHPQQQQAQQWGYAPTPFSAYGRPTGPGGWGAPPAPGDPYGGYASQAGGNPSTSSGGNSGNTSASGYVRPGPEENGRRSPPVPSISGQGRGYSNSGHGSHGHGHGHGHGSPQRSSATSNGHGTSGGGAGGGNSDRIQLAPLRVSGAAAEQAAVAAAAYASSVNSVNGGVLGKKNPLSIGSIISDES
ncbi:hypothetical protein A7U60_g2609 [Sanghuangporus baumii]|uniref:Velvet domain-containing protein n=1 Tax=Sanghuangporus baumii TaxID=108892 RepID=A0A9Q5I1W5_SANBA|nr:hypothetical protein A7U60_g2609 [Sanghuangporus baumii]